MTITPFDHYIEYISKKTKLTNTVLDLDDLRQVGFLTYLCVRDKPIPYILTSIKNAVHRYSKSFNIVPTDNVLSNLTSCNDLPDLERTFKEIAVSDFNYHILSNYYLNGVPVTELASELHCSKSTIYRVLEEGRRDLLNV